MGDENKETTDETKTETENQGGDPPAVPPPATPPPAAAKPQQQQGKPEKKIISMPTDAVAKMKQEARDKERKRIENELTVKAKAAGYSTYEEMIEAATSKRQDPPPAGDPPPSTTIPPQNSRKVEQMAREHAQERARLNKKINHEHKRRRRAERELDRERALRVLREAAVGVGIKDVDYAMHLLTEAHRGKTVAQLAGFDEVAYFEGLKETHPHLFGVTKAPATTGPGGAKPEAKPKAKTDEKPPTNGKKKNAREMTREEYDQHLRDQGIQPPARLF